MPTIAPTIVQKPSAGDNDGWLVTWANMANGDVGTAIDLLGFADRSVQVEGTFGAGGNLRMTGSNNGGTNYRALHDAQGTALNMTSAAVDQVGEVPALTRPEVTAGDGTTSLTVSMLCRRTRR